MTTLRPYQTDAIDALATYWERGGGNPLIEMATGTGKSVVIAETVRGLVEAFPALRVLMLVHVKELVQQNANALLRLWPNAPVGINSAGLGQRNDYAQVLFASIQSVFRRGAQIGPRDLIVIDEAHLVPPSGDGMYRALLDALREQTPDLRVVGFTATPYRLGSGRLDGPGNLFDEIVYSYGIREGIEDGFLSPLVAKSTAVTIDTGSVARRGGEYVAGALEAAADNSTLVEAASDEIVALGADRKSWIAFCCGVAHALHVRDALRRRGINAETVTGATPAAERDRLIRDFRAGRIRCLTNANVLTTGFDAPGVDLIAMLRPTLSTGLYVQMLGRGTRLAPGKENCLVLDYANVVRTHGPVDAIEVRDKKKSAAEHGQVLAKECPDCLTLNALAARTCVSCGHEYPPPLDKPKHEARADTAPILSGQKAEDLWIPVDNVFFGRHEKQGSPPSLRVTYQCGLLQHREWWCFEHGGFAKDKAQRLWKAAARGVTAAPKDTMEAMRRSGELRAPLEIKVRKAGKYFEVVGRRYQEMERAA
jgi:DNA repair protein RadD